MTDIIAIVDYGLGNLFSVRQAFEKTGIEATITSDASEVTEAPGILLPGVGAFGHAMTTLRQNGLADAIISAAGRGVPVLGICLGAQLLLSKKLRVRRARRAGTDTGRGKAARAEGTPWANAQNTARFMGADRAFGRGA